MKALVVVAAVAVALALRLGLRRRRRALESPLRRLWRGAAAHTGAPWLGDSGLVAAREIRERVRGRAFRVGTVLILLVVAAAIVVPVVGKGRGAENVGVVGTLTADQRQAVRALASRSNFDVRFVSEPDIRAGRAALRSGRIALCLTGSSILVKQAPSASDASSSAVFVRAVSAQLGTALAFAEAQLSPAQAERLAQAKPLPVVGLEPAHVKSAVQGTSIIGVILVFVMLSQYLTWTLIGVMDEKSSRVVEVLLATVRPIQLLAGKVLGIGAVAMGQAVVVLAFALALAAAVGSNLLHGAAPLELLAAGGWFLLGYGFYCWVYATAGSMIERMDQVQTLALPLSLPMLVGYVAAITAASTGSASIFVKVLAYLPPTAPFAMPILVGLSAVTWWQFAASALVSVGCTLAVARLAARVYRRAVLRTGRRVSLRELARLSRG